MHLVVNEYGELINLQLTPGNIDDRKPVPDLLKSLFGKVFADRGYVSQKLATQLLKELGMQFFAKPRRNTDSSRRRGNLASRVLMKNRLMRLTDKLLARKRSIIETIIVAVSAAPGACIQENADQLKNISQIEHSQGNVGGIHFRPLSAVSSLAG